MSEWSSALDVNLNLCAFSVFSVVSVAERLFTTESRGHGGFTEKLKLRYVTTPAFSLRTFLATERIGK